MKKSLLFLLLLLAALSFFVSAAGETPGSGRCGENVSWKLDADGTLTVSGSGAMTDYAVDGDGKSPFAAFESEIKDVVIEAGVTTVGDNAFYECYNVSEVTLPDGLVSVGDSAFYYCRELSELSIPDSVMVIGRRGFRSCLALETVTLPDGVERIGEKAFDDTAWYKAQPDGPVYLGNVLLAYKGEMPRKTEIAVREGTRLIADEAFWTCDRMIGLTLPEGLRHIGEDAFYQCSGIVTLTLPEGLLTIGERAFYCCGMESLELPRSLTGIGKAAFSGCRSLKSVFIPAGTETIGPEAFPEKTEIRGYDGTYAQRYAEQMGLKFTVLADPDAPETTTAPEGERAKARRRKQIGAVAACVLAGVIGVGAAVGLFILRRRPEDNTAEEE